MARATNLAVHLRVQRVRWTVESSEERTSRWIKRATEVSRNVRTATRQRCGSQMHLSPDFVRRRPRISFVAARIACDIRTSGVCVAISSAKRWCTVHEVVPRTFNLGRSTPRTGVTFDHTVRRLLHQGALVR